MARKKTSRKRKVTATRKSNSKKPVKKKSAAKKKAAARKKPAKKKAVRKKASRRPVGREATFPVALRRRDFAASGGQAGDTQGLSRREDEDSESVTELAEEGQYFEAGAVSGVEDAKDPDEGEVTTSEVPEDDVPSEYTDRD